MVNLGGFTNRYKLGSGLKPVFKIETCDKLSSGRIGDRIIEDTFPMFVKIADPDSGGIKSVLGLGALKSKITEFLGSQTTDTPMLGLMIDTAVLNTYRTITNIIFQNILKNKPTGNEYLSENLIECGYPIRVTMGFLTPEGNFVQHPYEGALTPEKIYPTFTGIVTAQTQEIVSSGDRFQITCYGFEYLLSKAMCKSFTARKGESLRVVFARLLKQFATMADHYTGTPSDVEVERELGGGKKDLKWPIPILRAMGLVDPNDKLLPQYKIAKNIRLVNCDRPQKLLHDFDVATAFSKRTTAVSYLSVIRKLSPPMPDIINEQLQVALADYVLGQRKFYTRHYFYFDYHGRPTIFGKFMSTAEIASGRKKPSHDPDRTRVHDSVIGSNVIHMQMNASLDMTAGRVDLYYLQPSPGAGPPSFTPAISEQAPYFAPRGNLEKDALRWYGPGSHFGMENLFIYDDGAYVDATMSEMEELLQDIAKRFKYAGMRGSSYMVCNPKMRVGDVLRVTDIRDKEGFGTAIGSVIDLGKKAATKLTSAILDRVPALSIGNRIKGQNVNLGLKGIEDLYWIWKVRHYVGQNEITSKAFFVKEPQTLITTTDAYRHHQIQRKQAAPAAGAPGVGP